MSIESAEPPEELKERIRQTLCKEGAMGHDEIVDLVSGDKSETQRALNMLWREGEVSHTIDRQFKLKSEESE